MREHHQIEIRIREIVQQRLEDINYNWDTDNLQDI